LALFERNEPLNKLPLVMKHCMNF